MINVNKTIPVYVNKTCKLGLISLSTISSQKSIKLSLAQTKSSNQTKNLKDSSLITEKAQKTNQILFITVHTNKLTILTKVNKIFTKKLIWLTKSSQVDGNYIKILKKVQ